MHSKLKNNLGKKDENPEMFKKLSLSPFPQQHK